MQAAWWGPMAVAIIAGILFATFLTLILVPVLYSLVDDVSEIFRKYYTHQAEEESPAHERADEPSHEGSTRGQPMLPAPVRPKAAPAGAHRESMKVGGLTEPQPEAG